MKIGSFGVTQLRQWYPFRKQSRGKLGFIFCEACGAECGIPGSEQGERREENDGGWLPGVTVV